MGKPIEEYTLAEAMKKVEEILNENPEPIKALSVIYQYDISGEEEGTYQLHLKDGLAKVVEGTEENADCTLQLSLANFRQFLLGKLNGTVAFMSGKLKIKGDIGKAIKMEGLLRQYNIKEYL